MSMCAYRLHISLLLGIRTGPSLTKRTHILVADFEGLCDLGGEVEHLDVVVVPDGG